MLVPGYVRGMLVPGYVRGMLVPGYVRGMLVPGVKTKIACITHLIMVCASEPYTKSPLILRALYYKELSMTKSPPY